MTTSDNKHIYDSIEAIVAVGNVVGALERFVPILASCPPIGEDQRSAVVTLVGAVEIVELQLRSAAVMLDGLQTALRTGVAG